MLFFPSSARHERAPAMKTAVLLCVLSLFLSARPQEQEPDKRDAITRYVDQQAEALAKELEGSWMLMEYRDPLVPDQEDAGSGFATFHDGFLTWMLAFDSAEDTLFGMREFLVLESGAYRYHVDEQAFLQLASVMSFTNNTDDGNVERDPSGEAFEYFAKIEDGVLELRDTEGITLTFRKVQAGDFPESAVRQIEKQRGGVDSWETDEGEEDEDR
jgi:hypothetical protein